MPPTDSRAEKDRDSKDVPWYHKELTNVSPACRELLENYSHIPPEEVDSHIVKTREKAWAIAPYPCIGMFRFLDLSISIQPCYARVLSFLKDPQSHHTLLDLGCCFGQDVRKLAHDGVPCANVYASDLESSFFELSYDLFKDRDTMKDCFITANAMAEKSALDEIEGKIDVVHAGSFLHLFSWDHQLTICKRIIKTLKPQKGSLVFGRQTGNLKGQEVPNRASVGQDSGMVWRHSMESFRQLWDQAGRGTGTKWNTRGELLEMGAGSSQFDQWAEEGFRRLNFEVERAE